MVEGEPVTCQALVMFRPSRKARPHEQPCAHPAKEYLIFGNLGVVRQSLCWKHREQVQKQHPKWTLTEKKVVRKPEVKPANMPVSKQQQQQQVVDDSDIPF